jgi:uncharacterized membrane protein
MTWHMKRLVNSFLRGLVFLVPIGATIYVLVAAFRAIDGLLGLPYPGIGVLLLVAGVTVIGALLSDYISSRVVAFFEAVLERLPLSRLIYTSIRDLMNAFVGEKKRFGSPAVIELVPGSGLRVLGFVTRDALEAFELKDDVAVYVPQAYAFAGHTFIVKKKQVQLIQVESSDVMAFIVSGGVAGK